MLLLSKGTSALVSCFWPALPVSDRSCSALEVELLSLRSSCLEASEGLKEMSVTLVSSSSVERAFLLKSVLKCGLSKLFDSSSPFSLTSTTLFNLVEM
uniref:Putative secreted protein n=1 Tax=Ixodes ricinus TaxID=34613 RepID=A0A6B0U4X6_IXORI